jgi:hypothetical protein
LKSGFFWDVWWTGTSVSDDPVASFFRIKKEIIQLIADKKMCRIFNVLLDDTR